MHVCSGGDRFCAVLTQEHRMHGFQIERYKPTFAGESTFGVERPWYSSERWFSADFVLDEGHNPAWIGVNRGGGHGAIDDQFVGHLDLAASFLDRFLFGISLPGDAVRRRDGP